MQYISNKIISVFSLAHVMLRWKKLSSISFTRCVVNSCQFKKNSENGYIVSRFGMKLQNRHAWVKPIYFDFIQIHLHRNFLTIELFFHFLQCKRTCSCCWVNVTHSDEINKQRSGIMGQYQNKRVIKVTKSVQAKKTNTQTTYKIKTIHKYIIYYN